QSRLAPEFSGRRTTRFSAKMHSGMPRVTPNKHAHSDVADEALRCLFKAGKIDLALRLFESARLEGHGNTVYSFSAMISAYGR
ncbi:pentatricopeptide repeat-containing protein, partial [Trifolium medium]|nr:pentatricopeptide repeat-containing protein [Trifolium medium]